MMNEDDTECNDARCNFIKKGISHKISEHKILQREEVKDLTPESIFKPTGEDLLYEGAKTGLSLIPGVGGPISSIFSSAMGSPVNKRLKSYLIQLDFRIKDLEKQHKVDPSQLFTNEEFIDAVIQSSQIAVRNFSQTKKIEYLQNAMINLAMGSQTPSVALTYLHYIDALTPIQLEILQILANPEESIKKIYQMNKGNKGEITYIDVLSDIRKLLNIDEITFNAAIRRLETDYLIDTTDKPPGPAKGGYREEELASYNLRELTNRTKRIITPFGNRFLEIIGKH